MSFCIRSKGYNMNIFVFTSTNIFPLLCHREQGTPGKREHHPFSHGYIEHPPLNK